MLPSLHRLTLTADPHRKKKALEHYVRVRTDTRAKLRRLHTDTGVIVEAHRASHGNRPFVFGVALLLLSLWFIAYVSLITASHDHHWVVAVVSGCCLSGIGFLLWSTWSVTTRESMIVVRAGHAFRALLGRPVPRPTSQAAVSRHVREGARAIGQGWSFVFRYEKCTGPIVVLGENWSGITAHGPCWEWVVVRSGTLFGPLDIALAQHGRALEDRPQFDELSVGGAVRTRSHGACTFIWFFELVEAVVAAERGGDGSAQTIDRTNELFEQACFGEQWVLICVRLRTKPDTAHRLRSRWYATASEVEYGNLSNASHMSVHVTNRHVLVRTVSSSQPADVPTAPPGEDTLRCMGAGLIFGGPTTDTVQTVMLSRSHTIVATMWPFEGLSIGWLGYSEMALFIDGWAEVDVSLIGTLEAFHRSHGGMTTVRRRRKTLVLDYSVPGICCQRRSNRVYFEMLYHSLGVRTVRFHTGKLVPFDPSPIRQVAENADRTEHTIIKLF